MQELFNEIRTKKRTLYFGNTTPLLARAILLAQDLFYFCTLNGIYDKYFSNSTYLETIKKYIEILFIAYTNEKNERYSIFNGGNILNKFTYFDFYLMMEIDYSSLKFLCNQFKIQILNCLEKVSNTLINTLENILEWRLKQDNRNYFLKIEEQLLPKILLLISKLNLNKEKLEYLIKIILQYKDSSIFFKKQNHLSLKILNKLFVKIIKI